ncbi:MAG: DMT family transporter [Elusimicrobiaceae bacterium]|nr:DMT family transporter [Elusimicrobiaceae bacterium]
MNILYFILLAFFWGSAYIGVKYTLDVVPPYTSAFLRTFVGFLFFAVWYLIAKKKVYLPLKTAWRPWLAGTLIMTLPFMFLYWGQRFIPAGTGGILNGTVPLWVFIIAALTIKGEDKFTWRKALGTLLGFGGLLLVFAPALQNFHTIDKNVLFGMASLLCMAICYALGNVFTKHILTGNITMEQNIFHQFWFSSASLFIAALIMGEPLPSSAIFTPKVLISMLYVGVCSSALALLLLYKLLKEWGALKASAATYFVPIVAVALDYILNGTIPGAYTISGMVVIIISLLLIK